VLTLAFLGAAGKRFLGLLFGTPSRVSLQKRFLPRKKPFWKP
jgi:hypothetical protein